MKKLITPALLCGALGLAACTNPYDPGQRAMAGMPAGALTGAAIGAGIGLATGPAAPVAAPAGALIGAGVGAIGGAGAGAATAPQAGYVPPHAQPSATFVPWPQAQQAPQVVYVIPPEKERVVIREQPQTIIQHDWPGQQLVATERTVTEHYEGYHPTY